MLAKSSWFFRITAALLLLFLVWIFAAWFLAARLNVEKPLERADVILVLGGSGTYVERTQQAAQLYKKGVAPKVLLTNDGGYSGWSKKENRNIPFVELAKRELIAQGVNEADVEVLSHQVEGTIYEANLMRDLQKERHYASILLVTSAYHSRRALWTFDRAFSEAGLKTVIGVQPAMIGQQTPPEFSWWLSLSGWQMVAGEYLKSLYYWLFL
jgi:uncharacterized SAM-binding protein YcdF (DUF218 family)